MKLTYYRPGQAGRKSPFDSRVRRPRRRWLSTSVNLLLIAAILTVLVYALLVRPEPKVIADSTAYHSTSVYLDAVAPKFKQLKNRNKLTLDQSGIAGDLKKRFPEIKRVAIELPVFSQVPMLKLYISQPSLILQSHGQNYILDSTGAAVGSHSVQNTDDLPHLVDQSGFAVKSGEQILSSTEVAFIKTLVAQAKRANVPVAEMILPPLAQELLLKTKDRSYVVKFYLGGDPLVQIGQFLAARNNFNAKNIQPKQYLDVRVAGKIYFK